MVLHVCFINRAWISTSCLQHFSSRAAHKHENATQRAAKKGSDKYLERFLDNKFKKFKKVQIIKQNFIYSVFTVC